MAFSSIPRPISPSEATAAFENAASAPSTPKSYILQDVLTLQAVADTLTRAIRDVALLFAGLDTARRTTSAKGFAIAVTPFTAAETDEYALVEALFWDRLSEEAETLLKVLLRKALREVQP